MDNYICLLKFQAGLRQCVLGRLPKLLAQHAIRLVIIDSIAGVFRSSYEVNEMKNRAEDMRSIGGQLHKIASQFNTCIICVNQVSLSLYCNFIFF